MGSTPLRSWGSRPGIMQGGYTCYSILPSTRPLERSVGPHLGYQRGHHRVQLAVVAPGDRPLALVRRAPSQDQADVVQLLRAAEARGNRLEHGQPPVSYTHLRAHETRHDLVCRLLLEK